MNQRKTIRILLDKEACEANKITIEVVFNTLKNLPHDTAIKAAGSNWGANKTWIELHNDRFPEAPLDAGSWEVSVVDGKIEWPEALAYLGKNDPLVDLDMWLAESPANNITVPELNNKRCYHQWYLTNRLSAIKHCKVCNAIAENDHSQD